MIKLGETRDGENTIWGVGAQLEGFYDEDG